MDAQFIQPKFCGPRFDKHTLPVEVARDLAAYETLLIELAKHLYRQDHPDRQRTPKGFTDVHLDIVELQEGSAMPTLALITAMALPVQSSLFSHDEYGYYHQARDLIAECIDAPETALPTKFPKELLAHFNQLGRSLKDDEALELHKADKSRVAVLNPAKRKKLVLAANASYEREVELIGSIAEADWEKQTFRLRLLDGNQASVHMPEIYRDREKIRQSGGRIRDRIFVKGVAAYNSYEQLQRVNYVDSLEVIKNYDLANRFDELAQMEAGWYDGEGEAPKRGQFELFVQKMTELYPEQLPLPSIVPTQDGNLLLEWEATGDPSADIDLDTLQASFHAFGENGEDLERDFHLTDENSYKAFFTFLSERISRSEAV